MLNPRSGSNENQEEGIELEDMTSLDEGSGAASAVSTEESGPHWIVEPIREEGPWKCLQQFDFSWFAWPVGTGITAIVTHAISDVSPQITDYFVKASIAYLVLTIFLFLYFLSLVIFRYCVWPKLFQVTIKNPDSVGHAAMMPTALATIIIITSKFVDNRPNHLTALWVLWWIAVVVSLVVLCNMLKVSAGAPYSFRYRIAQFIQPFLALTVVAVTRTDLAAQLDSSRAIATLISSSFILAVGVLFVPLAASLQCVVLYGIIPLSTGHIIDSFIAFASLAQTGLAIQHLGEQIYLRLPHTPGLLPGGFDIAYGGDRLGSFADVLARTLATESWFTCLIGLCYVSCIWLAKMLRSRFKLSFWNAQFSCAFFALSTYQLKRVSKSFAYVGFFYGILCIMLCNAYMFMVIGVVVRDGGIKSLLNPWELLGLGNVRRANSPSGPPQQGHDENTHRTRRQGSGE
ncbi:voltage-dependent anion channel-domain-containing protein [Xylaria arbuscula]|nr:voltage-dependent anion channel-domain-containing protein [Xylaria arbuscula]